MKPKLRVTEFDGGYFKWISVVDLRLSPRARKYETTSKTTCCHLSAIYMHVLTIIGGMFIERIQ